MTSATTDLMPDEELLEAVVERDTLLELARRGRPVSQGAIAETTRRVAEIGARLDLDRQHQKRWEAT